MSMIEVRTLGEKLALENRDMELELLPEIGGSVAAFRWRGIDLLRPAPLRDSGKLTALDMGAFPMVPFSGRIRDGRFGWRGRDVSLSPNFGAEPNAIHGHGWTSGWQVSWQERGMAVLSLDSAAGNWPWAFRAEQIFQLTANGLQLRMSVTNLEAVPMPAGLGWHPYFPADGARIGTNIAKGWSVGDAGFPGAPRELEATERLTGARRVQDIDLDTPFIAPAASASLSWPERRLRLELAATSPFDHLIVFTPRGEGYFCVEPATHVPDAHNSPLDPAVTGLCTLMPGMTLSASITLSAFST